MAMSKIKAELRMLALLTYLKITEIDDVSPNLYNYQGN